ncbi:MAG: helix-turn-helix transcriptional regulator [Bacteroidetes bacterium]|nr:helix-turn-helix transcriptional regulator [Fibrella sp.]
MPSQPLHLDLFALIILLGVAQGLFLGVFFLVGERGRDVANRCLGWLMLGLSAIIGEIFLCYSNYMFRVLALVDFSEPFNFVMGPLFFFFVFARIRGRLPKKWGLHLLPMVLWGINAVSWLYQPVELKYNNYLNAFHPDLPIIPEPVPYLPEDFTGGLRDYINELTLVSCLVYGILSLVVIRQAYRQIGQHFWRPAPVRLAQLRYLTFLFLALPVLIVVVKPQFHEDLGDYLLACYLTLIIYATSLLAMRGSTLFTGEPELQPLQAGPPLAGPLQARTLPEPKRKYEKSSLSEEVEEAILQKLTRCMDDQKAYVQSDLSLPKLAGQLNTTPHHLSQLLNDRLEQSFFDMLASYRIREAQQLLQSPATANLKIDEIAERVGYNSPSAFHTAFKRLTGQTPAQFRGTVAASR